VSEVTVDDEDVLDVMAEDENIEDEEKQDVDEEREVSDNDWCENTYFPIRFLCSSFNRLHR
jgi:transcriptional regulator of NAD metabolism